MKYKLTDTWWWRYSRVRMIKWYHYDRIHDICRSAMFIMRAIREEDSMESCQDYKQHDQINQKIVVKQTLARCGKVNRCCNQLWRSENYWVVKSDDLASLFSFIMGKIANHNYSLRSEPAGGFKTLEDFYPYYLGEHCNQINRRLHITGTQFVWLRRYLSSSTTID